MKIAILGYGLEGKSVENYFKKKDAEIDIFEEFSPDLKLKPKKYDYIFRSPSIPLHKIPKTWRHRLTSITDYFLEHCPCKIVGVTGTKGKGTTCTMIKALLDATGAHTYLVGNIGTPALDYLDEIIDHTSDPESKDVVVYELSSFQLWDVKRSPDIAVVLRVEPDHLNVHKNYNDYWSAKANIARFQHIGRDFIIYNRDCADSIKIVEEGEALALAYPFDLHGATDGLHVNLLKSLNMVGEHNKENLDAALLVAYCYIMSTTGQNPLFYPPEDFFTDYYVKFRQAIKKLEPLPHHIELVRKLKGVEYYDDSFCTVFPALDVALKSFEGRPLVLIAGGSSKGTDLTPAKDAIFSQKNLVKAVLIGETAEELADDEDPEKYVLAGTDFEEAVKTARSLAEGAGKGAVVLLSPCAASFDMFKSYKDRGDQFKAIVKSL